MYKHACMDNNVFGHAHRPRISFKQRQNICTFIRELPLQKLNSQIQTS